MNIESWQALISQLPELKGMDFDDDLVTNEVLSIDSIINEYKLSKEVKNEEEWMASTKTTDALTNYRRFERFFNAKCKTKKSKEL